MRERNKANIVLGAETQIPFLPADGRSDRCVDLNQVRGQFEAVAVAHGAAGGGNVLVTDRRNE